MAEKIKITPEELQAQAFELKNLERDFSILFSGVKSELKSVNSNWSANLSHNFAGKIQSAQKSFEQITQDLMNGAKVAETCAMTFRSVDSELSKLYHTDIIAGEITTNPLKDSLQEIVWGNNLAYNSEDIKTIGQLFEWIEEKYGQIPELIRGGADEFWEYFIPKDLQNLKDTYKIVSDIFQGEFGIKEGWAAVSGILKKNSKIAVVCESINYMFAKGDARQEEMMIELQEQLKEGDVLGLGIDMLEGFTDVVLAGSIETFGKVSGGYIDSKLNNGGWKAFNKSLEYTTGLIGWNEGKGYSVGGLIGHVGDKISDGIDLLTDVITDTTDDITSVMTSAVKSGINLVKSWFD